MTEKKLKIKLKELQCGFTLIELMVVIVIVGILAALALPRLTDMQVRARMAKLNGALSAVRSASSLAHAQCLAQPTPCATNDVAGTISMEGSVAVINQYPQAIANGIILAAGISTVNPADFIVTGGGVAATDTITISIPGASAGTCEFVYGAADWISPHIVAPAITDYVATCL